MYCVKCGVQLADTEKKCPLCDTVVYHPDIKQEEAQELYPAEKMPKKQSGRAFVCGAVIILFMIPLIVTFLSDVQYDGELEWFGYVAGALVIAYLTFALPMWFKDPNPVIFIPCDFGAVLLYLLYVDIVTKGGWFLSFAFPVTGSLCLITTALIALTRYIRRGRLYIYGGWLMIMGVWTVLVEFFLRLTFEVEHVHIVWSQYPLIVFFLLGMMLIVIAIVKPIKESLRRIFFVG
jgi:hypothetical protein